MDKLKSHECLFSLSYLRFPHMRMFMLVMLCRPWIRWSHVLLAFDLIATYSQAADRRITRQLHSIDTSTVVGRPTYICEIIGEDFQAGQDAKSLVVSVGRVFQGYGALR